MSLCTHRAVSLYAQCCLVPFVARAPAPIRTAALALNPGHKNKINRPYMHQIQMLHRPVEIMPSCYTNQHTDVLPHRTSNTALGRILSKWGTSVRSRSCTHVCPHHWRTTDPALCALHSVSCALCLALCASHSVPCTLCLVDGSPACSQIPRHPVLSGFDRCSHTPGVLPPRRLLLRTRLSEGPHPSTNPCSTRVSVTPLAWCICRSTYAGKYHLPHAVSARLTRARTDCGSRYHTSSHATEWEPLSQVNHLSARIGS